MRGLALALLLATVGTAGTASAAQTRAERTAAWRLGRAVRVSAAKMLDVAHGEKPYANLPTWSHAGLTLSVRWTGKRPHVELNGAGQHGVTVPVPAMSTGGGRGFFVRGNSLGSTLRAAAPGLTSKGFTRADRAWNAAVNAPR